MEFDYGLYIFRKDLRIEDNRGLIKLQKKCKEIIPIFIFDPNQVDLTSKTKYYLSFPALRFLCEAVGKLHSNLLKIKSLLYIFYGEPKIVVNYLLTYFQKSNK